MDLQKPQPFNLDFHDTELEAGLKQQDYSWDWSRLSRLVWPTRQTGGNTNEKRQRDRVHAKKTNGRGEKFKNKKRELARWANWFGKVKSESSSCHWQTLKINRPRDGEIACEGGEKTLKAQWRVTAEEKSLCRHLPRPIEDALVGVVTAKLWGAIRSGGQPFVIFQGREVTFSRLGAALTGWRFACKKIDKMASFASYWKVVLWRKCMFFFGGVYFI